jgi:hypothetical protein
MKKQLVAPLMLAALVSAPAQSQSTGESEKGKFTVTPALVSDYYWRGQNQHLKQGSTAFQPTIGYEKGPWSFDLGVSVPLNEKMGDTIYPEIDLSASYEFSFVNDYFKIKPGFLAYTYMTADDSGSTESDGDDFYKAVFEPTVSFVFAVKDFNLSLNLYYDVIQKGPTYEVVAGYTIPVTERIGVELSAMAGKFDLADTVPNSEEKEKLSGSYWHAGISVPIELTEKMAIVPGWYYAKGYGYTHQTGNDPKVSSQDEDKGRGVFSLSFSYTF